VSGVAYLVSVLMGSTLVWTLHHAKSVDKSGCFTQHSMHMTQDTPGSSLTSSMWVLPGAEARHETQVAQVNLQRCRERFHTG